MRQINEWVMSLSAHAILRYQIDAVKTLKIYLSNLLWNTKGCGGKKKFLSRARAVQKALIFWSFTIHKKKTATVCDYFAEL